MISAFDDFGVILSRSGPGEADGPLVTTGYLSVFVHYSFSDGDQGYKQAPGTNTSMG